MKTKTAARKINAAVVVIVSLFISLFAFVTAGIGAHHRTSRWLSTRSSTEFRPVRYDRPEVTFFVSSFCPYSNSFESSVRSVFDLLKSKADFVPHYLFQKVTDLPNFCERRFGSTSRCSDYVGRKLYRSLAECHNVVTANLNKCLDPKKYLRSGSGNLYTSIFGRQEMNQNIREICAWTSVGEDKTRWWDFVANVNKNCTADNADACWYDQALKASLDPAAITECFNKNAFSIVESEIIAASQAQTQGTPAVLINGVRFPPDNPAPTGSFKVAIGSVIYEENKLRHPETLKSAVCASMKLRSSLCKTVLPVPSPDIPSVGGCSNL